jgi:hypothetical protein
MIPRTAFYFFQALVVTIFIALKWKFVFEGPEIWGDDEDTLEAEAGVQDEAAPLLSNSNKKFKSEVLAK